MSNDSMDPTNIHEEMPGVRSLTFVEEIIALTVVPVSL